MTQNQFFANLLGKNPIVDDRGDLVVSGGTKIVLETVSSGMTVGRRFRRLGCVKSERVSVNSLEDERAEVLMKVVPVLNRDPVTLASEG